MNLQIECPGCQQSFEVSEELQGRTVECGSCEKRFQVSPEVIVQSRERFYPDEVKKEVDLSRFGKVPAKSAPVEFRTMEYDNAARQDFVGPVPPARIFATLVGLVILFLSCVAFYFGAQPGSSLLQDVEKFDRYLLAGFLGLLGLALLTWGMLKKRIVGILLGLLGAGGLGALAHFMPVHRTVNVGAPALVSGSSVIPEPGAGGEEAPIYFPGITEETLTPQEVMRRTRWEASVFPAMVNGDESLVAAVWVRSMEEFHGRQIQGYLKQQFGLSVPPYFRELGSNGGIFVMSGIPFDLDQVEAVVERFGEIEQVIPELRLVQMQVNASVLGEVSNELTAKLNNPEDGAFYSLNYGELIALDKDRVKAAIRRLAMAEPIRMRKDITVRLVGLLGEEFDEETYSRLADALKVWSEEGDGAERIVTELGTRLLSRGQQIPDGMMRFLSERRPPEAAALMVSAWADDPSSKQRFLEDYGSGVAPRLTSYLRSPDAAVSRAAARLLGAVGTKNELAEMRETLTGIQDETLRLALEEAIQRVAKR